MNEDINTGSPIVNVNNKKTIPKILLGVIVVLLLASALALWVNGMVKPNTSVAGTLSGQGIALYLPSDFKQPVADSSKNLKYYAETYSGSKDSKATVLVSTSPLSDPATAASDFSEALKTKKGDLYTGYQTMESNFIRAGSASGQNSLSPLDATKNPITLQAPVSFINKNISSNAWETDYSLARPSSSGQNIKVSGRFIYAIGGTAYYRILISSVDNGQQSNSKFFQKVLNSVKIDQ